MDLLQNDLVSSELEVHNAMASQEINSFVEKFHQLWKAGFTAHLDIDTHAGEAWVGLRVKLGHGREHHREGEHRASFYSKEENSSRQRRRLRRAAARLVQEKKSEETTVKVVSEEVANNVEDEKTDEKKSEANVSLTDDNISKASIAGNEEVFDIVQKKADIIAVEEAPNLIEENVENSVAKAAPAKNVDDADVDVVTVAVVPGVPLKNSDGNDNIAVKTVAMESVAVPPARPAIETVFATAVISHSSSSQVTNDEINYLLRIIRSKEHLNQNITSVDLGSVQSCKENGNKFEHKIQLMVHV